MKCGGFLFFNLFCVCAISGNGTADRASCWDACIISKRKPLAAIRLIRQLADSAFGTQTNRRTAVPLAEIGQQGAVKQRVDRAEGISANAKIGEVSISPINRYRKSERFPEVFGLVA